MSRSLEQRGIAEQAAQAKWIEHVYGDERGWLYPLHAVDGSMEMIDGDVHKRAWTRWKAMAGDTARQKYKWGRNGLYTQDKANNPTKPTCIAYYWTGYDVRPILRETGVLHIVAGEVDVLTFLAMGITNVTAFFGEANIPATLVEDLESWGVHTVHYYADNDHTGYSSADAVKERLGLSGITLHLWAMPEQYKDVNDWYLDNPTGDVMQARRSITSNEPQAVAREFDFQRYAQAITAALGAEWTGRNRGFSKNMPCIFDAHEHDDRNPAAGWSEEAGRFRCFKCGQTYTAKETADRLGINGADFMKATLTPAKAAVQPKGGGSGASTAAVQNARIVSTHDAMRVYEDALDPDKFDVGRVPLINPITSMHKLQGFGHMLSDGKLVAVLGLSGGGKTSFIESMFVDPWRQMGISGGYDGPEWTPDEYVQRIVHRHGGATTDKIMLHMVWKAEERRRRANQPTSSYGKRLSDDELVRTRTVLDAVRSWQGQCYYLDEPSWDLGKRLDALSAFITDKRQQGVDIRYWVWDYIQLIDVLGSSDDRSRVQNAIKLLKAFVAEHRIIGIVASQPTKSASGDAKQGETLVAEAAQFMRDWEFNLFITLKPILNEEGQAMFGRVNVTKNSTGRGGQLDLAVDFKHLRWIDGPVPMALLQQEGA